MNEPGAGVSAEKCCPRVPAPGKRSGVAGLFAGIGAAILASLCCFGPLLGIAVGISGATALAGLARYQPIMVGVAIALIALVGLYFWRSNRQFWKPFVVSLATFGAALLLIYQVLIPFLSRQVASSSGSSIPAISDVQDRKQGAFMQATFGINGMSCISCAATIERTLANSPGIKSATVSYENKIAKVVYDSKELDPNQISNAIAKAGYQANLRGPATPVR